MQFVFKQISEHGTQNPIVARLVVQTFELLESCNLSDQENEKVIDLYMGSLQPKLLRCWEIEQRISREWVAALGKYQSAFMPGQAVELPQIMRLEEDCHNFFYESKNFVRDLLKVSNVLFATEFVEASEFFAPKMKNKKPVRPAFVEWAKVHFGQQKELGSFFEQFRDLITEVVRARNAIEHPGGHSGNLHISNIELEPNGGLKPPDWYREKDGKVVGGFWTVSLNLTKIVSTLLDLGEGVFYAWACNNLKDPKIMQIYEIAEKERKQECPIRFKVSLTQELAKKLIEADRQNNSQD